jgi:hypothetical protein
MFHRRYLNVYKLNYNTKPRQSCFIKVDIQPEFDWKLATRARTGSAHLQN